jgi:drug/metabolite transporter (DMT)-like permease
VRFRWILLSLGTFLFTGGIGIMQTLAKPDEQIPFLQIAFALCALFNLAGQLLVRKKGGTSFPIRSRTTIMALGSGIAMGAVNRINLYLADPNVMATYIFFPIVNGGLIFLTTVAAMIFFKERLTRKQWIGLVLGIVMLTVIGIV